MNEHRDRLVVYAHGLYVITWIKKGHRIDDVMRLVIIIDAAVTNAQ